MKIGSYECLVGGLPCSAAQCARYEIQSSVLTDRMSLKTHHVTARYVQNSALVSAAKRFRSGARTL